MISCPNLESVPPTTRRCLVLSSALFFSLAVTSCSGDANSLGLQNSFNGAAIVGGQLDFEHVAVFDILVDGEQSCTGTLVSPHVVLTAAHCIVEDVDNATELEVFTGPNEFNLAGGTLHAVLAGPYHPTYGTDDEVGDIAVLILEEPSDIPPMPYSRTPLNSNLIGDDVVIVGYGDATAVEPTSGGGRRKSATVPVQDVDENWIVVGDDPGESQCYGDSGGPVLMEIDGVEQIVGINSWSDTDDCGDPEYNTRVDAFVAFVDQHVQAIDPDYEPGEVDAGVVVDDGGAGKTDAGPGTNDAGTIDVDAGFPDEDAGSDEESDAGSSENDDAGASEHADGGACSDEADDTDDEEDQRSDDVPTVACSSSEVHGTEMPASIALLLLVGALSSRRRRRG